jgi:hypothetical protein
MMMMIILQNLIHLHTFFSNNTIIFWILSFVTFKIKQNNRSSDENFKQYLPYFYPTLSINYNMLWLQSASGKKLDPVPSDFWYLIFLKATLCQHTNRAQTIFPKEGKGKDHSLETLQVCSRHSKKVPDCYLALTCNVLSN